MIAIYKGNPTNAVITELKKTEIPTKIRGIQPEDNYIRVDLPGQEGNADVKIYRRLKNEKSRRGRYGCCKRPQGNTHYTQRLGITCTLFQAELYGISMAFDWVQSQGKKTSYYAISADSKAALLATANKNTTHPLAVASRLKTIKLRTSTSINFHRVKGHAGLKGNERADYLAKTAASYITIIAYDAIPNTQGRQKLEDHYTKIWKALYVNSANASHTKLFIPTIFHRLSLSLWPNFILTQFLTNHGRYRSYLRKINKTPSQNCNCPEKAIQTARNLMMGCSLFSYDRPAVFKSLPPPLVLKYHINTVSITSFLRNIFHALQEECKGN
jgi:ribonuclease HI